MAIKGGKKKSWPRYPEYSKGHVAIEGGGIQGYPAACCGKVH